MQTHVEVSTRAAKDSLVTCGCPDEKGREWGLSGLEVSRRLWRRSAQTRLARINPPPTSSESRLTPSSTVFSASPSFSTSLALRQPDPHSFPSLELSKFEGRAEFQLGGILWHFFVLLTNIRALLGISVLVVRLLFSSVA